jgi:hypothetical protein
VPRLYLFLCLTSFLNAQSPRELIEQYAADAALLQRHWSITGDSPAALDREQQMLQDWLLKLGRLDFSKLSKADQIDYILCRNDLEASLMRLGDRRDEVQELRAWLPFRSSIDTLTEQRVKGTPLEVEKAAAVLAPLAKKLTDLQTKLKAAKEKKPDVKTDAKNESQPLTLPTALQALRAAESTDTLRESLKNWFSNYSGFLPDFSWWMKQPYEEAVKARMTPRCSAKPKVPAISRNSSIMNSFLIQPRNSSASPSGSSPGVKRR